MIAELKVALAERFGHLADLPELLLADADADVRGKLTDFAQRPLPIGFTGVLRQTSLGGSSIGISFGSDAGSMGYANWVISSTQAARASIPVEWLFVAESDPFYCVLCLSTGEIFAWPRSESFETRFGLNCDFEQLVLGVGSVMTCRGTPDETHTRVLVAERLDSPLAFWNAI